MMLNCVITDDEPIAVEILEDYIHMVSGLRLVAQCKSAMETLAVLRRQTVDVLFLDIDVPEQVIVHETVVARRMSGRKAHVFIQVERRDPPPVQLHLHQFTVEQQRRAASSQTQHSVRLFAQQSPHKPCRNACGGFRSRLYDDFHFKGQ